jgi:serine/threonine protein kinase
VTGPRVLGSKEPEQVGDYEVVARLGEGGQGAVYLGESPEGTRVAIKVLHARFAAEAEVRRRFLREADVAARVAGFCTARVIGTGMLDERPYIVSEYIPGPSLEELVRTGGPRTGSGLERLAVATLTALASIHRAGVVHRDFKPGNVILGPEGPVVIDFGIARALDLLTSNADVGGTPAYVSPEQLGNETMTPASDMFSWASTMVFAATGRLAFPATSIPAVLHAVLYGEPDVSDVPEPLRAMVAACLAKNPAARPSAAELLRSLTGEDADPAAQDRTARDRTARAQVSWDQTAWTLRGLERPPAERSDEFLTRTLVELPAAANPAPVNPVTMNSAATEAAADAAPADPAPGEPGPDRPIVSGLSGTPHASDKLIWGPNSPATGEPDQAPGTRPERPRKARNRTRLLTITAVITIAAAAGALFIPFTPSENNDLGNLPAAGEKVEIVIGQAKFSRVDVTDRFAADTYPTYAAYQPFVREPLPLVTSGGGKFAAAGSAPYFGLFASPTVLSAGEAVSMVTIGAFTGSGQPEDSAFVGWVKNANNYVAAWYNNTRREAGFDVRVNGAFPRGYGTTRLTLVPGDRFAVRLSGNALTSYVEHGGVWRQVRTVAIGDVLATPQKRQQYRYGFGLRGSTGAISVTALAGLSA